jgi:hypothetical protein
LLLRGGGGGGNGVGGGGGAGGFQNSNRVFLLLQEQLTQLRLVVAGLERQRLTGKQKEPAEALIPVF